MTDVYYPKAKMEAILAEAQIPAGAAEDGALFSENAGAPGSTFVTLIRLDTSGKDCYVWDGTQYVKIGEYA